MYFTCVGEVGDVTHGYWRGLRVQVSCGDRGGAKKGAKTIGANASRGQGVGEPKKSEQVARSRRKNSSEKKP